ncbi:hypothetical protein [Anaerosolibacter sp.]|jgi:hypothetical protein|nr:hypothetical protein [Anaerosolibacter sp.]MDF2547120.1 hypothetical protein [Anaerosolibacter sp.]
MTVCDKKFCSCPDENCEIHGQCCVCIQFHLEDGSLVHCMKEFAGKSSQS